MLVLLLLVVVIVVYFGQRNTILCLCSTVLAVRPVRITLWTGGVEVGMNGTRPRG